MKYYSSGTEKECCYLWGYEEGKIEKPADGLDGDCVVHYVGMHTEQIMKVKIVDGMREGEATIFNNGIPYMKLNYRHGKLNGSIMKLNKSGGILMKGALVNGKESGVFKEYTHGFLTWIGYYQDGRRYSLLRKSAHMTGYYEEWSVMDDRTLLSIAEYDAELTDKNGYCIECEDGKLQKCKYKNGVKWLATPEVEEWSGIPTKGIEEISRKRDAPEERSIDSSKRPRLSSFLPELNDGSLVFYDMEAGLEYGIIRSKEKCYEVKRSYFENQMVEVDLNNHEIHVHRNNEWSEHVQEEGCLDLDSNGRRWEGGIQDNKPFGYGVLYDEDGRKVYEGFMMNDIKVCYGIEYYSEIERVQYEGCYYDSKRFGKGILYDRNGAIAYDGLWMDDEYYSSESCERTFSNYSQILTVPNGSLSEATSFRLSPWFDSLKQIVFGNECGGKIQLFEINGLSSLESIEIRGRPIGKSMQARDVCRIMNCPKLESICFPNRSFSCCSIFELKNLPSLQSISINKDCFAKVLSLSISGMRSIA